ncbi:hypothetical protein [Tsukamurella soli]|uniref:Uncharacterized protein n=1 Tax=Tsukamurella soli TaxID=644556 RepID=A0ABP8J6S5_9ACTN
MTTFSDATRETQLYIHTVASAFAAWHEATIPAEMAAVRRPETKEEAEALIAALITTFEANGARKKIAPSGIHPATMGRLLAERGERYDAQKRTYTTSQGFDAMVGLYLEERAGEGEH